MLLPVHPSKEILLLLRDPKYALNVYYLQGSPLLESDLKRSRADTASAIFIMSDKFSSMPDNEDAKNILQNLSILRYLGVGDAAVAQKPTCCMQLLRPDNLRHLQGEEIISSKEDCLVVCLNEIKMGTISKALVYPGANILLMNLISTFSDEDMPEEDTSAADLSSSASDIKSSQWLQ
jgi:hypothetical protein